MSKHTSYKAGGAAELFIEPSDKDGLKEVLKILNEAAYPHIILGNGTNILVRDGGYAGVVVKIGEKFSAISREGNKLICGAGALMSSVSEASVKFALEGFEFASGIPGSVGGAVFMNAGAYGGEMSDILEKAHLVSKDGSRDYWISAQDLKMGYRHTTLHDTGEIVIEAALELKKGDGQAIKDRIEELAQRRKSKQPLDYPSCGSFFKRPKGYFAGTMIQEAGLQGLVVGGAQVSELHAGFIINRGGATASDILQLMEIVQAVVMDKHGIKLEPEVRIIGDELR